MLYAFLVVFLLFFLKR